MSDDKNTTPGDEQPAAKSEQPQAPEGQPAEKTEEQLKQEAKERKKAERKAEASRKAKEKRKKLADAKARLTGSEWDTFKGLVKRMFKDLRDSDALLPYEQVRYMVDSYYQLQRFRIRASNQITSSGIEPCELLDGLFTILSTCEQGIASSLDRFSSNYRVGNWLKSICGIGPILTAGLLTHLDIRRAPSAGNFYSFAGIRPGLKLEKGKKRPWNGKLKTLCFLCGESFCKVAKNKKDFYGKLMAQRRAYENAQDDAGMHAAQAAEMLATKKYKTNTPTYARLKSGHLSDGHLHARARRWVVKLFISHVHHVMYVDYYGHEPPQRPYPLETEPEKHVHYIAPPNWPREFPGQPLAALLPSEEQIRKWAEARAESKKKAKKPDFELADMYDDDDVEREYE